jgi:hypothetical protein
LSRACGTCRERRGAYGVSVGRHEERDHLEDLGISGRIILKWIIKKWNGEDFTVLLWLRIGTGNRLL